MQQSTKTYARINEFLGVANAWLERNPKESKLGYAIRKEQKIAVRLMGIYQEEVEDISITYCAADKDDVILRDERGGFRYTREQLKQRNRKVNELFKSEVEIEPYYSTEIPTDLTAYERDVFAGFVLRERPALDDASSSADVLQMNGSATVEEGAAARN